MQFTMIALCFDITLKQCACNHDDFTYCRLDYNVQRTLIAHKTHQKKWYLKLNVNPVNI